MDFESTVYSGYLGLGPYSSSSDIVEENIVKWLMKENDIDHAIISLYLPKDGIASIKFGSYDPMAIKDSAPLDSFKTLDLETWTIGAMAPTVNEKSISSNTNLKLLIDP